MVETMINPVTLKWIVGILIVIWISWAGLVEKKKYKNWEGYSLKEKLLFSTIHFTVLMVIISVVSLFLRSFF